jgi:hypothetical protein
VLRRLRRAARLLLPVQMLGDLALLGAGARVGYCSGPCAAASNEHRAPAATPARLPGESLRLPGRGRRTGEHWWPVALAILVAAGLHVALCAQYR